MFCFVEADCVVDGIKPTVSVDSIGLLALMGWMNAELCWLESEKADLQCCLVLRASRMLQISPDKFKVAYSEMKIRQR